MDLSCSQEFEARVADKCQVSLSPRILIHFVTRAKKFRHRCCSQVSYRHFRRRQCTGKWNFTSTNSWSTSFNQFIKFCVKLWTCRVSHCKSITIPIFATSSKLDRSHEFFRRRWTISIRMGAIRSNTECKSSLLLTHDADSPTREKIRMRFWFGYAHAIKNSGRIRICRYRTLVLLVGTNSS